MFMRGCLLVTWLKFVEFIDVIFTAVRATGRQWRDKVMTSQFECLPLNMKEHHEVPLNLLDQ